MEPQLLLFFHLLWYLWQSFFLVYKRLVQKKYADADDNIIVRVHQFRGYHEYANYEILYNNVNTDDSVTEEKTFVSFDNITVVEEF